MMKQEHIDIQHEEAMKSKLNYILVVNKNYKSFSFVKKLDVFHLFFQRAFFKYHPFFYHFGKFDDIESACLYRAMLTSKKIFARTR